MTNPFEYQANEPAQSVAENFQGKLLDSFTVDSAEATIREEFPSLEIKSCNLIKSGDMTLADDNLVVEVNGDLIFKFPVKYVSNGRREMEYLKFLDGKINTTVPKVLYVGEKTFCYGTDKMQGEHLGKDWYENASPEERDVLAHGIASFLSELHTNVPLENATEMGIKEDSLDSSWPIERLRAVIEAEAGDSQGFKDFLLRAAESYHSVNTRGSEKKVYLHHDLSNGNFFIDPTTKKLKGVIDFGNISTGDCYIDFASLYRNRPEFGLAVAKRYSELTGTEIDSQRVFATGAVKEITHLVQSPKKRQKSLKRLNGWYEESKSVQ